MAFKRIIKTKHSVGTMLRNCSIAPKAESDSYWSTAPVFKAVNYFVISNCFASRNVFVTKGRPNWY